MCPKIVVEANIDEGEEPRNKFKATLGARVIATAPTRDALDDKVSDWLSRHIEYIVNKGYANVYVYEFVEAVEIEIKAEVDEEPVV
jgi:hypothetical protein